MAPSDRPDHDALYHRLFGDPGVVAHLLRAFVTGPWIADLDLDRMERLNAKFHAETGQRREGDMIWRIPRRDGADTYLVLLLEFQSTGDTFMALRVLTYASLLWQQVVTERRLPADGKLPPLLPVVLYNGEPRWRAPESVRGLVGLPAGSPLWRWQPDLSYHLIDVGTFSAADLAARDGLPALWFRLENAEDPGEVLAAAEAVRAWLVAHPGFTAARAAFIELLDAMVAPRDAEPRVTEDFLDMQSRLLARARQWEQQWLREGRQEGRQEGEAALLLRQLERRFGALPAWATDRVLGAETGVLEDWGLRILEAGSLDDVLGKPPD